LAPLAEAKPLAEGEKQALFKNLYWIAALKYMKIGVRGVEHRHFLEPKNVKHLRTAKQTEERYPYYKNL
jgi:hypothetical protein